MSGFPISSPCLSVGLAADEVLISGPISIGTNRAAYERLLNLVITLDHLKFSIFAGLANALGERRN
jgi:hypothetical protein